MRRYFPGTVFLIGSCILGFFILTVLAGSVFAQNGAATADQPLPVLPELPSATTTQDETTTQPLLPADDAATITTTTTTTNPLANSIVSQTTTTETLPGETPILPGEAPAAPPVPDFFKDNAAALTPEPSLNDPAADASFEKSKEELKEEARQRAFDAALEGILPLRPDEIRQLLEQFDRTQESVELPVYPSPRPEVAVETISLDPGTKPAVVKVAYGNVTTLNILDVSGAPWPIEDVSWAGNFEIIEAGSGDGSHIIRISPQSEFATGNISIRLLTLKTPVILSIETSREMVHYRFDALIPEYGPLATSPLIDKGITTTAGDSTITAILQGVPPASAAKLEVSGVDGRTSAYRVSGRTYVRTPLTLLSPSWSASVSSADGMNVYAVSSAPVLLLSDKGRMVRAKISERQDILEGATHD